MSARTLLPLLGPLGGGLGFAAALVATAASGFSSAAGAGSARAAGSSSARGTSLQPSRVDGRKLTRLLTPPLVGMPAASMNLEVADAMLVLAIGTASSRAVCRC